MLRPNTAFSNRPDSTSPRPRPWIISGSDIYPGSAPGPGSGPGMFRVGRELKNATYGRWQLEGRRDTLFRKELWAFDGR